MDKLICPFCQQEMRRTNGIHNKVGVWQCQNSNDPDNVCIASGYLFNDDVLNYITSTRKALDIAVDALKWIAYDENNEQSALDEYAIQEMIEKADKAIKQITALEQKEHFADVSKKIEQKDVK